MNIFIPILFLVSLTLAEPPVGDGYPEARSSHDQHHNGDNNHHDSEHQRSLSQSYGPPSSATSRNAISNEYGVPNVRSGQSAGRQSQKHAAPTARVSFNQRFSSPLTAGRSSSQERANSANSRSQEYTAPNARNAISQEYGPPADRSPSQEYGVPSVVSARTLSTEYGMPDARSTPSQEYGVPNIAARNSDNVRSSASHTFNDQSSTEFSQDHSAHSARSQFQTDNQFNSNKGYSAPSVRSNNVGQDFASRSAPSSTYGVPSSRSPSSYDSPSSRSFSNSYETPSARNSDFHSQDYNSIPSDQRDLSETYGAPNARSLSQEYGVPSKRNNQNSNAAESSYAPASSRSSPSTTYLPAARDAMPSQEYGVPEQDHQGYDDNASARAINELLNQEPANYDFAYQIEDQESGSDFGHTETREDNRAHGSYFVVLPDGTKQTVEYEADERGYKPRISVEPAAGGYDENSAELARSAEGPY